MPRTKVLMINKKTALWLILLGGVPPEALAKGGAPRGIRTPDRLLKRQLLYQAEL